MPENQIYAIQVKLPYDLTYAFNGAYKDCTYVHLRFKMQINPFPFTLNSTLKILSHKKIKTHPMEWSDVFTLKKLSLSRAADFTISSRFLSRHYVKMIYCIESIMNSVEFA